MKIKLNMVSVMVVLAAAILLFGAYHTKILSPSMITGTPIPHPMPGSSPALHVLKAN